MAEHILVTNIRGAKSVREKWQIKNTEFEKLSFPMKYSVDGIDIEILSAKGNKKDILEVQLNVLKNGETMDVNAPFLFQNPPVMHDEKIDMEAALKVFVLDTIKTQIK